MTLDELQQELDTRDDGVLKHGSHKEGREFCALEFACQVRGVGWSDDPALAALPDLRRLNDARWSSDAARTKGLLPVMVALWGWATWTPEKRKAWATRVAIQTVRQIISELPRLSDEHRAACRAAETLGQARSAARAADAAYAADAANAAAYAADAADAADAAAAAAYAAARASRSPDDVLTTACRIWIEAVPS